MTSHAEEKIKPITLFWLALLIAGALVALVIVFGPAATHTPGAPITSYSPPRVELSASDLCPGESFEYSSTVKYSYTPAVIFVTVSIWSHDLNRTVVYDARPMYAVYSDDVTVLQSAAYTVPLTLPPGRYELRRAATGEARRSATLTVPFRVKECG